MSRKPKEEDVNSLIDNLSGSLALEVLKMIDDLRDKAGDDAAQMVTVRFLAAFTTASVVRAIGDKAETQSSRERYEAACNRFSTHKSLVQDAVAAGFQSAMSSFTGNEVEYYCTIKVVPEMGSRSVN